MTAFSGQNTVLSIGYGAGTTPTITIGRVTTKTLNSTLDNIDVTADDSAGQIREYIETFIGQTLSFSAYTGKDSARAAAVDDLEEFFYDPTAQTQTDRVIRVKLTRPKSAVGGPPEVAQTRSYEMDVLISSLNLEAPHDGAVSFSFEGNSTSAVTITDANVV